MANNNKQPTKVKSEDALYMSDQDVRKCFEMLREGTPEERHQATEALHEGFEKWVFHYVHTHFKSFVDPKNPLKLEEDIFSCAWQGFQESWESFDPDEGALTTWSKSFIHHAVSSLITPEVSHMRPHELSKINKIKARLGDALLDENPNLYKLHCMVPDVSWRDLELAIGPGIQVHSLTKMNKDNEPEDNTDGYSYEADDVIGADTDVFGNPEQSAINSSIASVIQRCIEEDLSPSEKSVLLRCVVNNEDHKFVAMSLGLTVAQVRRLVENATHKLSLNPQLRMLRKDYHQETLDTIRYDNVTFTPVQVAKATMDTLTADEFEFMDPDDACNHA